MATGEAQALQHHAGPGEHFDQPVVGLGAAADDGAAGALADEGEGIADVEVAVEVVVLVQHVTLLVAPGGQAEAVGFGLEDDAVRPRQRVGGGDRVAQGAVGIADAVVAVVGLVDDEVGSAGRQAEKGKGQCGARGAEARGDTWHVHDPS